MNLEHVLKTQISPLKIKWPPPTIVSKDLPSCQPWKTDQVENEDEGQHAPLKQLRMDHLHQIEDEFHQ